MRASVIIPVKNRASLLDITLKNILNQNLTPYEIIVVDDGSTDDIGYVIEKYRSPFIHFIKNCGRGPGAARNEGLRRATGDAIQFFDSDDLMTCNKLEVQIKLLESTGADFVYGPYVKASEENGEWKQLAEIMQYHPLPSGKLKNFVLEGWCLLTQSVLFRRSLLDKVGPWREDLMPHEDYELWFRIGTFTNRYVHENQSCIFYRQHIKQITDAEVPDKIRGQDGIKAMDQIERQLQRPFSVKSHLIFLARKSMAKMNINKNQGDGLLYEISWRDRAMVFLLRVSSFLRTKVFKKKWPAIYGSLAKGGEQFRAYRILIK